MREKRLNHLAAEIERMKKTRLEKTTAEYKSLQKRSLFEGSTRTYTPNVVGDKTLEIPTEVTQVQSKVQDALQSIVNSESEMLDHVYQQDVGNQEAKADVLLKDGTVLLTKVPVTNLMYLRKRIGDWATCVGSIPTHNPAVEWIYDKGQRLYRSKEPSRRQKTAKTAVVITLAPPTDKHPAQTQLIYEDKPVGEYIDTLFSGCERADVKEEMLKYAEEVLQAIDNAIQTANMEVKIDPKNVIADKLFGYLLQPMRKAYAVT